jgi:hypothetical protein
MVEIRQISNAEDFQIIYVYVLPSMSESITLQPANADCTWWLNSKEYHSERVEIRVLWERF